MDWMTQTVTFMGGAVEQDGKDPQRLAVDSGGPEVLKLSGN